MQFTLALGLLVGLVAADEPAKPDAVKTTPAKAAAPATPKDDQAAGDEQPAGPKPQVVMEEVSALLLELRELDEATPAGKAQAVKLIQKIVDQTGVVVKQNPPGRIFQQAAQLHILGYRELVARGGDAEEAAARKALATLSENDNQAVAMMATQILGSLKFVILPRLAPKERDAVVASVLDDVKASKFSGSSIRSARELGDRLEDLPGYDAAGYYEALAELVTSAGDPKLATQATRFQGVARRLRLPGNSIELTGTIVGGKEFDWSKYQGKVVLVEFWATWCGPCIQELPNVKALYKKYHDQGFEVVGISLDSSEEKLTEFLEKEEIPWTILFEAGKDQQGWANPIAGKYGVSGIPTAILVGKDGKVVSLNARGPLLTKELAKQFGSTAKAPSAP